MKNYIISLKEKNIKRREHIKNEFKKHNLEYTFLNAITPDMNTGVLSLYGLNNIYTTLTPCEISCFLSHFIIWNEIIEQNISFTAIFEDDIYLGENAYKFLTNNDWISPDIDIIKLEKGWQKMIKTSLFPKASIHNRKLYQLKSAHYGTAGYIISNRGAKYLIEYYKKTKKIVAVDILIFNELLNKKDYNIQQLLPAICIQDFILNDNLNINFKSALEEDRAKNYIFTYQDKKNKTLIYKIKRESIRPFIQLYHFLYKTIFMKSVYYK